MWQEEDEPQTVVGHVGRILLREERPDPVTLVGRGVLLLLLLFWTWSLATASIASNKAGESFLHVINWLHLDHTPARAHGRCDGDDHRARLGRGARRRALAARADRVRGQRAV